MLVLIESILRTPFWREARPWPHDDFRRARTRKHRAKPPPVNHLFLLGFIPRSIGRERTFLPSGKSCRASLSLVGK
jgi:hypothetical protein